MSNLTPNLNLFKYDVSTDANVPFSITKALNNNWDILDDMPSTKVDLNAENLSNDGKSLISGLGMPSNKYIDLTLGASGSFYTAPANGYYYLAKVATAGGQYNVLVTSSNMRMDGKSSDSGGWCAVYIPIRKGADVYVEYTTLGEVKYFRFIYAEGSK